MHLFRVQLVSRYDCLGAQHETPQVIRKTEHHPLPSFHTSELRSAFCLFLVPPMIESGQIRWHICVQLICRDLSVNVPLY